MTVPSTSANNNNSNNTNPRLSAAPYHTGHKSTDTLKRLDSIMLQYQQQLQQYSALSLPQQPPTSTTMTSLPSPYHSMRPLVPHSLPMPHSHSHTSLPSLQQQLPGVYLPNVLYDNNSNSSNMMSYNNLGNKGAAGGRILVRDNQHQGGKYRGRMLEMTMMGNRTDTHHARPLSPSDPCSLASPTDTGSLNNRV